MQEMAFREGVAKIHKDMRIAGSWGVVHWKKK